MHNRRWESWNRRDGTPRDGVDAHASQGGDMRSTFGTALLVVILASVVPAPAMQSGDDTLHVVLPKDTIHAIDRPTFEAARVSSETAYSWLSDR